MFAELIDREKILKEINDDFSVSFDYTHNEYCISHKNVLFKRLSIDEFDRKEIERIRYQVWLNENGNVLEEIDKNNEKLEKEKENKATDMNYQMAKDIRKPLLKEIYGV